MTAQLPFRLPAPTRGPVDVFLVAGEHSGDEHAAAMIRDLRGRHPELAIAALGGPQLAAAGAQVLHDLTASSVVGLVEVLKNYSFFKALFAETLRWIAEHRPRVVCLVDYPGFNLRLAAALRERGLSVKGGGKTKVVYYISPQIWAWKAGRRFTMARDLDAMAVIFPFEPQCYADTNLPVEFVGHPFLVGAGEAPVKYDPAGPILLLPGSRRQAVQRIFPVVVGGFQALGERDAVVLFPSPEILEVLRSLHPPPNVKFLPAVERRPGKGGAASSPASVAPDFSLGERPIGASAVLTSSGTMSMHCALAAIPGAIAYRANPLTYLIGRMLVQVEQLGIANLLLREQVYPEYLQGAATPEALATELRACLHDPARGQRIQDQARRLRALLSVPADRTAAEWLGRQLGK